LSAELERLRSYAADVDPAAAEDFELDPDLKAAIDARVPGEPEKQVTDPGA
jgi:hypothetical protein